MELHLVGGEDSRDPINIVLDGVSSPMARAKGLDVALAKLFRLLFVAEVK